MMELDLNELERLAESATQGPWVACGPSFGAALPKYLNEVVVDDPDSEEDGIEICQPPTGLDKESSRDMEFIAAANPSVVLELVRRLRESEKDAARYRWLRALPKGSCHGSGMTITIANARPGPCSWMNDSVRGDDMDAAIDAAMQST